MLTKESEDTEAKSKDIQEIELDIRMNTETPRTTLTDSGTKSKPSDPTPSNAEMDTTRRTGKSDKLKPRLLSLKAS